MNRKSIIKTMKILCSDDFLKGKTRKGQQLKYLKILEGWGEESMGAILGIEQSGFWCITKGKDVWMPKESSEFHAFHSLLSIPLDKFVAEIKAGLQSLNLPLKIAYTFPFDELLLSAIKDSTSSRKKAEQWLKQNYPINDEIALSLCHGNKQSERWIQWLEKRLHPLLNNVHI